MKTPRIAVAGMGYWGKNLVRVFQELGALEGVCDSSPAVTKTVEQDCKGVRYYREFSGVLTRADIDAVALATPAVTHFEMAKAALLAGKDVYVEKPLAIEKRQGAELVAIASA